MSTEEKITEVERLRQLRANQTSGVPAKIPSIASLIGLERPAALVAWDLKRTEMATNALLTKVATASDDDFDALADTFDALARQEHLDIADELIDALEDEALKLKASLAVMTVKRDVQKGKAQASNASLTKVTAERDKFLLQLNYVAPGGGVEDSIRQQLAIYTEWQRQLSGMTTVNADDVANLLGALGLKIEA